MKKLILSFALLLAGAGAWAQEETVPRPFQTSDAPTNGVWAENTTWYFINFPHFDDFHTGGYLAAEGAGFISQYGYDGSGDARTSKGKLLITKTEKPIKPSALWCVVGDETEGYTFYNKMNPYLRLGMTSNLGETKLYGPQDIDGVVYKFMANTTTHDDYKNRADCCTFYTGTNSYWNDQDGGSNDDYLKCWTSDVAQDAGGGVVCFTEVTAEELQQMTDAVTVPVSQESDTKKNYFRIRNLRSLKYAMYNGDAARLTQTDDVASIRTLWYVTEDGNGYHFYNAASSKKYAGLNSFTEEGTKMYIKENPYCAGLFCISTNENFGGTSCWDDDQHSGFSGGWTPGKTDYAGTSWYMEKVNTDEISTDEIKEELNTQISALQAKFDNVAVGMPLLTETGKGVLDEAIAKATEEMDKETLDRTALLEQIRTLNALEAELGTNSAYRKVKAPAKGKFYRLKNAVNGRYMADLPEENANNILMSDAVSPEENRAATIFYLDENNELLSYTGGRYLDCGGKNLAAVGTKLAGEFGFAHGGPTANVVTYKNNGHWTFGNKGNNESIDRGSGSANQPGYNWTFEEVAWLPVPMNTTAGWGTIYSPVQLTCGNGRVEAYTVSAVAADKASVALNKVDYIPANTGVILKYLSGAENGNVFLQIQATSTETVESKLTGTFATSNIADEAYVLSMPESQKVGLYKAQKSDTWQNNAFKAYLPASALDDNIEAAYLVFDFGNETAIKGIEAATTNGAIYDLSGRRVKSAVKGIYIINGKKVIK